MPSVAVMPLVEEFAAAKLNLTLEVHGRRPDGYHALSSLVAFALSAGDRLTLHPGAVLSLQTTGPEAGAIDGPNLVITAATAISAANPALTTGAFRLEKHLPVAAGIGGGSADAAAAIRAIARINSIADPASVFAGLAAALGADIPVCIGRAGTPPAAAFITGTGDRVWRPPASAPLLPAGLAALLVNPRIAVPTRDVFEALGAAPLAGEQAADAGPPALTTTAACLAYLAARPNDLEPAAIKIAPVIADILAALRHLRACRLARMSGSGATCFGLFEGLDAADHAATALRASHPGWWITASQLA